MSHFDISKELVGHASAVGLEAILYQTNEKKEKHTIAYASQAMRVMLKNITHKLSKNH